MESKSFIFFGGSFRFVVFVYTCFLGKDKVQEQVAHFFWMMKIR